MGKRKELERIVIANNGVIRKYTLKKEGYGVNIEIIKPKSIIPLGNPTNIGAYDDPNKKAPKRANAYTSKDVWLGGIIVQYYKLARG